ncbi:unnamed protein product [Hydatigera taeniaeformis]|uniref:Uncharacterized protein n=1 Tax=Hydatigena taeniaeformis TaxID=6205 RepID=A0A0R3WSQ3_HYDTA|nr:unnamed protein product [Hydatigera taeniaeformis]
MEKRHNGLVEDLLEFAYVDGATEFAAAFIVSPAIFQTLKVRLLVMDATGCGGSDGDPSTATNSCNDPKVN